MHVFARYVFHSFLAPAIQIFCYAIQGWVMTWTYVNYHTMCQETPHSDDVSVNGIERPALVGTDGYLNAVQRDVVRGIRPRYQRSCTPYLQ
jgi:hypothetical protein